MKQIIYAFFFLACTAVMAQNEEIETQKWSGNRPDGHAPISVMSDHTHGKGEFMVSYRYMSMNMEGLKRGSDDEKFENVLIPNGGNYMVTPTEMPMQMHMIGAMFAPSDKITLFGMLNILSMEMTHLTGTGVSFKTESSGFGDAKLGMIYKFFNKNRNQLHGQLGFSLPTGSIDNKDVTPASEGNNVILPYPMQIGSGTLDSELSLTYLLQGDNWSIGSQLKGVFRLGENSNDYRLGNKYNLNNWFAVTAANWLSVSARIEGAIAGEISGANPDLNPMMVTTADTNNSGGTFINSGLGFNIYVPNGSLKNLRFGFEFATPLFQDVNGVQLKTKETITLGVQYAF